MGGGTDFNDILNKLTEDPNTLKKLMNVAGSLFDDKEKNASDDCRKNDGCLCGEGKEKDDYGDKCTENECKCESKEVCHDNKERCVKPSKYSKDIENLIRLLYALKPYSGNARCEKIDSVIKILKLVQFAEKAGKLNDLL